MLGYISSRMKKHCPVIHGSYPDLMGLRCFKRERERRTNGAEPETVCFTFHLNVGGKIVRIVVALQSKLVVVTRFIADHGRSTCPSAS